MAACHRIQPAQVCVLLSAPAKLNDRDHSSRGYRRVESAIWISHINYWQNRAVDDQPAMFYVVRLAEMPQVIGLKEATGDVTRPARLRSLVGQGFQLWSGDDATALAFLAQGGDGCISVTSNVVPGPCRGMFLAYRHGHMMRATRLADAISRVTSALFRETSPVPLRYALSLLGLMSSRIRLH